jgi:hypothetical protein
MNVGISASEKEQRAEGPESKKPAQGNPRGLFCSYVFGHGGMTSTPE